MTAAARRAAPTMANSVRPMTICFHKVVPRKARAREVRIRYEASVVLILGHGLTARATYATIN